MSNPTPRALAAQVQGEDFPSMILELQRHVARLQRANATGDRTLNWTVTTPAVPATTVAATNTNARPVTVYVRGGTVTNISVGGVALGMTSGTFRVNPGDTIAITYSVAPTWSWYGD